MVNALSVRGTVVGATSMGRYDQVPALVQFIDPQQIIVSNNFHDLYLSKIFYIEQEVNSLKFIYASFITSWPLRHCSEGVLTIVEFMHLSSSSSIKAMNCGCSKQLKGRSKNLCETCLPPYSPSMTDRLSQIN